MELLKYNFICPICKKEYYTYIERQKYQELITRNQSARDIFENYNKSYSQLFTIGYCNTCQSKEFDTVNELFCLSETEENKDSVLYDKIYNLERF